MINEEEARVFREFCGLSSRDASDYKELDPPDYVRKDGALAVELVSYHLDQVVKGESIAKRLDSEAKNLVSQAKELFEARFTERLNVYVSMQSGWKPTRAAVGEVARGLAELVGQYRHQEIEISMSVLPPVLVGAILGVSIGPAPVYRLESHWQYVSAAFTEVLPQAVQATLSKKEEKIADYRRHAQSVELLIYSSPWPCVGDPANLAPSSCGTVTDELLDTFFETSFDKVHYLDRQWNKLIQLKVKRPPIKCHLTSDC